MSRKKSLSNNPNVLFENKYEDIKKYINQIIFYNVWGLIGIFSIHIILIFKLGLNDMILSILSSLFGWWYPLIMGILIISISILIPINNFFFSEPSIDSWIIDLSYDRLNTEVILYYKNKLFFSYDSKYNASDIKGFILDLNKRSEDYNYFLTGIDLNNSLFSIESYKKVGLPSEIDNEKVYNNSNEIYLGVFSNKTIDDFVWDFKNKNDDYSNSLLIIGEYNSGKQNLHNIILSHLDKIDSEIILMNNNTDVNILEKIENVKSYSSIDDFNVSDLLSLQDIMYERINIPVNKEKVKYYKISGKYLQFNEIMHVFHDNESKYMTAEAVYKKLQNKENIELIE